MKYFNEYEVWIKEFALYPSVGKCDNAALSYTALGLTGEAGEYAEKIKKKLRDGDEKFNPEAAAKELGDVLWYITRSANELGYSLRDIAAMNVAKLTARKAKGTLQGSGDNR